MRSMYRNIIVLEDAVIISEQCLDHWVNMISHNVQVILAVDPTMQGNDEIDIIPRYGCPNHHLSTSVLHCGKNAVSVVSFSGLPIGPAVGKREQLYSSENITSFHWSTYQPLWSLHHFNLFWMPIVEGKGFLMAAFPWYPALLSSRWIVLVENELFSCWLISLVTLASVVQCFLLTMRFNASRPLSVSLEVRPELCRLIARGFPCFLNSVMVLAMEVLVKPSTSTLLVTEAPAIRLSTIYHFQTQFGHAV